MGNQFKPKSTNLKVPSGGSGSKMYGISQLMGAMRDQKKGQAGEEALPGGIATKRTDPAEQVTYESENSRFFTADAQNQKNRISQIKNIVRGVQDLGSTLPTDIFGAAKGVIGAKYGSGRFGTEQHKTYMDSLPTAAAATYRAISGDNRLSDVDAASRALPLFWSPFEPETVREGKNSFVNFMLDEAEKNITPGEPADPMEALIRWQSFVNNSKKKFGNPSNPAGKTNYQIGQVVRVGFKNYKVTDTANPDDPEVEEIQ